MFLPTFSQFRGSRAKLASLFLAMILAAGSAAAQAPNALEDQIRTLNNELLRLDAAARGVPAGELAALRGEAPPVIQQRASALSQLIQTNPSAALKYVFSTDLAATLAAEFPGSASALETSGTWQGPVEQWTFDSADLKSSRTVLRLRSGQRDLEIHFAGSEPAHLKSGDLLQATGVLVNTTMLVSSSSVQPATATSGCSLTGVQNTAVLLVNLPGATLATGVTPQSVSDVFFGTSTGHSLDGFLREASYGQTSAAGSVFGPYSLTGTYSSCTDVGGAILNDAIAAATSSGVNLNNYSRVFLIFPNSLGCTWSGYANVGGCSIASTSGTFNASIAYMVSDATTNRDMGVEYASHEMGHNFGLLHSGVITTSNATDVLGPVSSPGTFWDQGGDYWSTLGELVLGLYPAPQKAEVLGWLKPTSNYQVVQSSGTYTLQPLESSSTGLQAIKVQRGTGNSEWLWVEYRQPVGNYDSNLAPQPFSGALIHYEDTNTRLGHTYLPNFTPSDTTGWSPALAVGKTWTDPYTNLSLAVLSATSSGLTISVNYGAVPCSHANPTVTMSPANPSASAGSAVSYTVSIANNDTSGCSASTFNLASSQPSGWSGSLSAGSLSLNPGQTGSVTLTEAVPAGTSPGTFSVTSNATSLSYAGSGTANCSVVASSSLSESLSIAGSVFTARQTVPVTATVLYGNSAAAGATVVFTLTKANGTKVSGSATTDSTGKASWSYKVTSKDPAGGYSVTSSASYNAQTASSNTATFTVQ